MWSQVLAFVAGAAVALSAQALGHSLTSRRERRGDFVRALDNAVSAFASGERVLDDLTDSIERALSASMFEGWPEYVEDALQQGERTRVEMRAALFSIRVRVRREDSPVFRAFDGSFSAWQTAFLKAKITVREFGDGWNDIKDAYPHAERFRGEFYDVALERAADAVGRLNA